jgi:hypothetical protein
MSELRGQRSEIRNQRSEVGMRKTKQLIAAAGLTPETRNHIPVDGNKTGIKFKGHVTGNFHHSNPKLTKGHIKEIKC